MQHSSNGAVKFSAAAFQGEQRQTPSNESLTGLTIALHVEHVATKKELARISTYLDKLQGFLPDEFKTEEEKIINGLLDELKEESYAAASITQWASRLANRLEVVIGGTISQAQGTTGGEDLSFRRH